MVSTVKTLVVRAQNKLFTGTSVYGSVTVLTFHIFVKVPVLCCGPAAWNFTLKTQESERLSPSASVRLRRAGRADAVTLAGLNAAALLGHLRGRRGHRRVPAAAGFINTHVRFICLALSNNGGFTGVLTLQRWRKSHGYDAGLRAATECLA